MEVVDAGAPVAVVVDYAHTPAGLGRGAAGRAGAGRRRAGCVCLFGCGGDRDPGKRPEMGAVATTLADVVVLTSDNPRSEDPAGHHRGRCGPACTGPAEVVVEPDRAAAVRVAVGRARPGDVVLLAGKGHEGTQTTGRHGGALRRPGGGRRPPSPSGSPAGEARPVISLMTSGGVALWVAVLTTPFLIRWLLKNNIGQQIREDGPQVHIAKAGTPTMGGICIVGAVAGRVPVGPRDPRGALVAVGGAGDVGHRRGGGHRVRRRLDQGAPPAQPRAQQAGQVRVADGARGVVLGPGRLLGPRLDHAVVHPLQLDRAAHGHRRLGGVGHAHHRRRRPTP